MTKEEKYDREQGQTDVAALAAGVVAITVSIFVTPGPYDQLEAVVALTLGMIVFGYVWQHRRSKVQSFAVGAVCGLIAVPVAGFLAEISLALILDAERDSKGNELSRVPTSVLLVVWLLVSGIVYNLDKRRWSSL